MIQRRFWMRGGSGGLGALAALITTLCCLGFPALVGLLTALGAGFLLSDRYLAPLLAATLLFTLLIDGLHLRRHHQPGPFILSLVAAGSVFFAIYGVGLLPHVPPCWRSPPHRDGHTVLSLSSDHYPAASDLSLGRNSTGEFAHPQYWTGRDLRQSLLHRGTSARVPAPVQPITESE